MTTPTNPPTVADAYARLSKRKEAAGLAVSPLDHPRVMRARDMTGVLSGTDLTPDEVDGVTAAFGRLAVPLAIALGIVEAAGSVAVDGLLTGLELAAMRNEITPQGQIIRTLQTRLVNMAELALEVAEVLEDGPSPFADVDGSPPRELARAARGILDEAGRR